MNQWVTHSGLFVSPIATTHADEQGREGAATGGAQTWNPKSFEQEQIRGLVRRVFLSAEGIPARQIAFSALEPDTDVGGLCRSVGGVLSQQEVGDVAVVTRNPSVFPVEVPACEDATEFPAEIRGATLRRQAIRAQSHLWLLRGVPCSRNASPAQRRSFLCDLRRDFEYSIIEAPPAGDVDDVIASAELSDGVILVLSARRTRRATALRLKQSLDAARVKILGSVLSDRVFPIPEKIYRRL